MLLWWKTSEKSYIILRPRQGKDGTKHQRPENDLRKSVTSNHCGSFTWYSNDMGCSKTGNSSGLTSAGTRRMGVHSSRTYATSCRQLLSFDSLDSTASGRCYAMPPVGFFFCGPQETQSDFASIPNYDPSSTVSGVATSPDQKVTSS